MLEAWLERYRRHDRQALARLVSLVARGDQVSEILRGVPAPAKPSRVVAITGAGGVGKSTLIGKLIELLRRRHLAVAVLACDPQSPLSGGALLGDRFRMPAQPDDGVYIRSLATAGGQGAVARHLAELIRVLEGFGFDVVLIETVGAGQGDTAVRDLADAIVVLVQPEAGDDLQWEKAGLLEIADVVAIHKADLPGAEQTQAQVKNMLSLSAGRSVSILRVSAKSGEGLEQLWDLLAGPPLRRRASDGDAELLRRAQDLLARRFATAPSAVADLIAQWKKGSVPEAEAAERLLRLLAE